MPKLQALRSMLESMTTGNVNHANNAVDCHLTSSGIRVRQCMQPESDDSCVRVRASMQKVAELELQQKILTLPLALRI